MEARYYSDNLMNVEKYGFEYMDLDAIAQKLTGMDLVVPYSNLALTALA